MTQFDVAATEAASLTDTGQIRAANQDACAEFSGKAGARLFVVCDGMGGHQGGETASRIAVDTIGEVFQAGEDPSEELIHDAFVSANERIFQTAQKNVKLTGMGSTGVGLLLGGNGMVWRAHVGDSRAYRVRRGRIEQLTDDHSVVGAMVRQGLITLEEAAVHPRRNEILRSLGAQMAVDVDVAPVNVEPGDRLVLCSDGLSGMVPDSEIATVVGRHRPRDAARLLVDMANARGGTDNVTVQVVEIPGGDPSDTGYRDWLTSSEEVVQELPEADPSRVRWLSRAAAVVGGLLLAAVLWALLSSSDGVPASDAPPPQAESIGASP